MSNILDNLDGIPGANRIKNSQNNTGSVNYSHEKPVSRWNSALPQNKVSQNPANVAYIRGISGTYNDQRIIIHEGDTYTFGRSPKNQITFDDHARAISRLHLSLQALPSEKKVILIDLDSSYGTYDASKKRYVSNHPYELHAGDTFWIGYNEMFKIEFE